jgi:hypothetical protein
MDPCPFPCAARNRPGEQAPARSRGPFKRGRVSGPRGPFSLHRTRGPFPAQVSKRRPHSRGPCKRGRVSRPRGPFPAQVSKRRPPFPRPVASAQSLRWQGQGPNTVVIATVVRNVTVEGRSNWENRHKRCNRRIRPLLRLDAPAKMKVCRGSVNGWCGNPQDSGVLKPASNRRWPASANTRSLRVALGGSNRRFAVIARRDWSGQADVGGRDSRIERRVRAVTARPASQWLAGGRRRVGSNRQHLVGEFWNLPWPRRVHDVCATIMPRYCALSITPPRGIYVRREPN